MDCMKQKKQADETKNESIEDKANANKKVKKRQFYFWNGFHGNEM